MKFRGDAVPVLVLVTCCSPSDQLSKFLHPLHFAVIGLGVISVSSELFLGFFDADIESGSYHDLILSGNMGLSERKLYKCLFLE